MFSFLTKITGFFAPFLGKIKIAAVILLAVSLVGGFFYIKSLKSDIDLYQLKTSTMEQTIQNQKVAIDNINTDVQLIKDFNKDFQEVSNNQQAAIDELNTKFTTNKNGDPRDLGNLADKKPKLIQNAINNGTKDVNRCFELISGAKLENGEDNESIENCEENRE